MGLHSTGVAPAATAAQVPIAAGAAHSGASTHEALPSAVVKQLQECSDRWPVEDGSSRSSNNSNSSSRWPVEDGSSSSSSDLRPHLRDRSIPSSSCDLSEAASNCGASSTTRSSTGSYLRVLKDADVQRVVLGDVIKLCQVLQQEVPTIVGCNNPTCLNLSGMLESTASRKACTGCNVAHYCSRECQVGHWKEHRPTCNRLQKEQSAGKKPRKQ